MWKQLAFLGVPQDTSGQGVAPPRSQVKGHCRKKSYIHLPVLALCDKMITSSCLGRGCSSSRTGVRWGEIVFVPRSGPSLRISIALLILVFSS